MEDQYADDVKARMARMKAKREARNKVKPELTPDEAEYQAYKAAQPGRPRKRSPETGAPNAQIQVTFRLLKKCYDAMIQAGDALPDGQPRKGLVDAIRALNDRTGGHLESGTVPADGAWEAKRGAPTKEYEITWADGTTERVQGRKAAADLLGITVESLGVRMSSGEGRYRKRVKRTDARGRAMPDGEITCRLAE